MIKKKATADTIVGLFVFLAIVGVNLITFLIREDLFGGTTTVRARFDSVSGLEVGAPVLVSGIRAGRVTGIDYAPRPALTVKARESLPVIVKMVVDDDIPVYSDARVRLVQQGFVGDKRVEIDPGSADMGTLLSDDSEPLEGQPQFDMQRVIKQAEVMVDDLQETVSGFREFVTNDTNMAMIGETIENLNRSVDKVHDYLTANEEDVAESVAYLRDISYNLRQLSADALRFTEPGGEGDKLIAEIQQTISDFRYEVNELTGKTEQTIDTVNTTVQNLDERSERLTGSAVTFLDSTQQDFSELTSNLEETSTNIQTLIEKIRRGEGTVGRLFTDPTPFEDLKVSIQALRNFIVRQQGGYSELSVPYENEGNSDNIESTPENSDSWYQNNPGNGE